MKAFATKAELGRLTGKSESWVRKVLARDGAPKPTKNGRYRVAAYLAFEESFLGTAKDGETLAELNVIKRREEIRKLRADADKAELSYERDRGLLVPRDEVLGLVGRLAQVVVHALEASQADVSARFPAAPEVVDQYDGMVRRLRERLAEEVEGMGVGG